MNKEWKKDSWRSFPIKQQPIYGDLDELKTVEKQIASFPPLVSFEEIKKLKAELALVSKGEAFLLQGGDCAESFAEFSHDNLRNFFRTMVQMTITLMYGLEKPIVKVGRIAGQYAKPRSQEYETIGSSTLPCYRGDIINDIKFNLESRKPNPKRLIDAYFYSSASLNYLKSLASDGYASLEKVNEWNKEFALLQQDFEHLVDSKKTITEVVNKIDKIFNFMNACGINSTSMPQITAASFFTSHEALLLNYEEAFVKQENISGDFYALGAHSLWIGDRTRNPKEAHVEFMRGISNPIAFKVGPSITKDDLLHLLDILNPKNEAGRITLISRMGRDKIGEFLPPLIRAIKSEGKNVVWSCDPMHGNTIKSSNDYKTRRFDDILGEITSFFQIHNAEKTYAGGIHLEMTGQNVTECLGGNQQISEMNLQDRYHTHCDPRLNSSQSIELAFMIAQDLKKEITK